MTDITILSINTIMNITIAGIIERDWWCRKIKQDKTVPGKLRYQKRIF